MDTRDMRTALEKHVDYMGGDRKDGEDISYTSMADRNEKLGDDWLSARATAGKVSLGGGMIIHGCPFSHFKPKQAASALMHSHHTGLYTSNGDFNENLWENELCPYAETNAQGVKILTEKQFYKFLDARRKLETNPEFLGETKSNAEWTNYWSKFFTGTDSKGERSVELQKLRDFFVDSSKPGKEVEERVANSRRLKK